MQNERLELGRCLVEISERPVEAGDQVMVELSVMDSEEEVVYEPGTLVQTGGDAWYTGIESLVIGLEKNSKAVGEVSFDAGARIKAVAGRTFQVTVKILSIQAYEVPT
ncbi:MAG: hypothetical protein AAFS10_16700 [Myxococcota bacterium]